MLHSTRSLAGVSDGDDGPTLEMLTHPSSLTHLIVMLHEAGLASVAERAVLLSMAESGDPRCLAAFDVYRDMLTAIENDEGGDDKDEQRHGALDDLVDTCMRICKRELSHGPYHPRHSSFQLTNDGVVQLAPRDAGALDEDEGGLAREETEGKEDDGIELRTFSESFDNTPDETDQLIGAGPGLDEGAEDEDERPTIFSDSDRVEVVRMMQTSEVLSEDEAAILELLIDKKNRHVDMAFRMYDETKAVEDLALTLKKISQTAGEFLVNNLQEDKQEQEQGASEYDRLFEFVDKMNLNDIQTAALRLSIAKNDPALRAALEAFRITENGKDIQDTLWKIIKRTIEGVEVSENSNGAAATGGNPAGGANVPEKVPKAKADADADADAEAQTVEVEAANPDKFTDMERRYIFTMLISELSKQEIISAVQGSDLLAKYNNGEAGVIGALDEYEVDRSMEVFVGKLTSMARAL